MKKFLIFVFLLLLTVNPTFADWILDLDPPTAAISATCTSCTTGSTSTVSVSCSSDSGGSGCSTTNECSVGSSSGPWVASPCSVSSNTTVYGRTRDNAGNWSTNLPSATITFSSTCSGPDLRISQGPSLNSGTLTSGNTVTFTGTVQNQGCATAGGTFNNRFEIDTDNISGIFSTADVTLSPSPTITALSASGTSAVISGSWTNIPSGTHILKLCADQPTPAVSESDETNNCASSSFTVSSAPTPSPDSVPWIQTTGGDVHSNTKINIPGGP